MEACWEKYALPRQSARRLRREQSGVKGRPLAALPVRGGRLIQATRTVGPDLRR
jgi:hypothetical protein